MLVSNDSPLRKLPVNLSPEQRLIVDGIRYAAEIIELALERLTNTLKSISPNDLPHISAFSDAWTIVDSAHRFFKLTSRLKSKPLSRQETPATVANVIKLRNAFHHIHENYNNLANLKTPAFGHICWITLESYSPNSTCGKIHTLVSGAVVQGSNFKVVNPGNKVFFGPIDYLSLSAHGHTIYFQEIVDYIAEQIKGMESGMRRQIADLPKAGADIYLVMEFFFDK